MSERVMNDLFRLAAQSRELITGKRCSWHVLIAGYTTIVPGFVAPGAQSKAIVPSTPF